MVFSERWLETPVERVDTGRLSADKERGTAYRESVRLGLDTPGRIPAGFPVAWH